MEKATTGAKAPKATTGAKDKASVPEQDQTVIEVIEDVLQHLENAESSMTLALVKLNQSGGSTMRIVGAKQMLTEMIKNLRPYLED
jgi:hypothetical protein